MMNGKTIEEASMSEADKIKSNYTIDELTEKCRKYFNAFFDPEDEDHVEVARNKVFNVEYKNGVKRSRPVIRKMTRDFRKSLTKQPIK